MDCTCVPRTITVPLRTGDIVWPNATVHTQVGGENYSVNYQLHPVEINNQYGFRSANGETTTWKNIDLSTLMQGAVAPRSFRITVVERRMQGESDPGGDGTMNPPNLLFDTFLSVASSGGSNDRWLSTHYSSGEAILRGRQVQSGFHTGRTYGTSVGSYAEKDPLSPNENREGTFVVDPFNPFVSITIDIRTIYPSRGETDFNIGLINALVKISEIV